MNTPILCLLLLCTSICTAQAQNRWFRPDQLFSYAVTALCADTVPRGMWGIVCNPTEASYSTYAVQGYDGSSWHTYSTAEYGYPLRESTRLFDIGRDRQHNIIVTAQNNILRFNRSSKTWNVVQFLDSLRESRDFHHIITDTKGQTWITAEARTILRRDTIHGIPTSWSIPYNEIFRLNGDTLQKILHYISPVSSFTNIAEDSNGDLWVAQRTQDGSGLDALLNYDGTTFKSVPIPADARAVRGSTTAFSIDSDDNFYIGCQSFEDGPGVYRPATVTKIDRTRSTVINYEIPYGIDVSPDVKTITAQNNIVYIGTREGLYTIDADQIRRIEMRDYFPDFNTPPYLQSTNDLYIRDNGLHCATSWGIVIFDPLTGLSAVSPEQYHIQAFIHPNPVERSRTIIVTLNLDEGETITGVGLVGIRGEEISPVMMTGAPPSSVRIETAGLPSGPYIVRTRTNKRLYQAKLIIAER